MQRRLVPNTWLWTVGAISGLLWALIALLYLSLGPVQYVPHVFFSYRFEHFAAFYSVAVLAAAGLPRTRLTYLALGLSALAIVLELVRTLIPPHQSTTAQDLVADLAGVGALLLPIVLGRFRRIVVEGSEAGSKT